MGISDHVIAFSVVNGALDKVAEDEAGFERHDGRWVISAGPGVPIDVEMFHGSGWKGMRATLACGIFDPESGPHTGQCFVAVASNGKRAMVAETEGSIGNDPATARSVESIRVTK